jgi:predicted permease
MQDIRYALRTIAAHPWFSAAVVATLALGIGINATVFTLANTVLYKPLPFPNGDRIVVVDNTQPAQSQTKLPMSYPDFLDLRAQTSSFERLDALATGNGVLSETTVPAERVNFARTTAGLFATTGVAPMLGRTLTPDDERPSAPLAVVIGEDVWRTRYHGDPGVIGRAVRVDDTPGTIVGVMPRIFSLPNNEKMWTPLRPDGRDRDARDNRYLTVIGLLKPHTSIAAAARDANAAAERLASAYPDSNRQIRAEVLTFNERFNGNKVHTVFSLMFAAVGLVLLVACANVANMMLGAALRRHREMAVRTALGASRWRIVRQLLVESVLLSLFGGLAGLGIAVGGVRAFNAAVTSENTGKPAWIIFAVDYRVIVYLAVICVTCGIVFGLAPALRSSRVDLNDTLKEGGRGGSGRASWLSDVLVVAQFTMAVVLLAASGLMMRSFVAGQTVNPTVPRAHILSATVMLPASRYPDKDSRLRFFENVLPQVAALPGVTQAALTTNLPGNGSGNPRFEIDGHLFDKPADRPSAFSVVASAGYFPLADLPILRGRSFDAADGDPGHEVAIVSRAFAATYWPNADAVGRRLRFHGDGKPDPWMTVVGVSGDLVQDPNHLAAGTTAQPIIFTPYRSADATYMLIAVRTAGDAAALTNTLRATMQHADADLALSSVKTLDAELSGQLWPYRVFGTLFLVFAIAALLMAAVGLYAVMSQATLRRTREIGIRMALGATPARVLRTVMRRGVVQLTIGLVLGLAAAFATTGAMRSLLLGVEPSDPLTFAVTASVLLVVGLFACWLPANRAATIPPVRALAQTGE